MTVTTLQTILITALIATWLVFSIVFLISSIQSFFNDMFAYIKFFRSIG